MFFHRKKNPHHVLGIISIALALILRATFTANAAATADSSQCTPVVEQTIAEAEILYSEDTNALPQITNQTVAASLSAALQNLQQAIISLSTATDCGTVASTSGVAPAGIASQSAPTAQLSINASYMPTAPNIGGYGVGYPWTLSIISNLPNAAVILCAIDNHDVQTCTPGYGSTNANGDWTLNGSFDPSTVGPWEEWAQLTDDGQTISSNHINFNVAAFTPLGGPVGTQVTIYGSGFHGANTVLMNGLVGSGMQGVSSPDGNILSFRIPGTLMADCTAGQACPSFVENVSPPNTYSLSVVTGGGVTQDIGTFAVTAATSAAQLTCTVLPDPSYNPLEVDLSMDSSVGVITATGISTPSYVWSAPAGVTLSTPTGASGGDVVAKVASTGTTYIVGVTDVTPGDNNASTNCHIGGTSLFFWSGVTS